MSNLGPILPWWIILAPTLWVLVDSMIASKTTTLTGMQQHGNDSRPAAPR